MLQLTPAVAAVTPPNTTSMQQTLTDEPSTTLDPIVVVANQTPTAISDIPATVWYIDEAQVDEAARTGKRLGDFTARLPVSSSVPPPIETWPL